MRTLFIQGLLIFLTPLTAWSSAQMNISSHSLIITEQTTLTSRQQSGGVHGSGNSITEIRSVSPFWGIRLQLPAELIYSPAAETELQLQADDNLLPIIDTRVVDGILVISARESFSSRSPIRIRCGSRLLEQASVQGTGRIDIHNIIQPRLQLTLQGSGDISAHGGVGQLSAYVLGSGDISARGLNARRCKLTVQGSGDIGAYCADSLSARVLGSGDISVGGAPATTELSQIGAGSIEIE